MTELIQVLTSSLAVSNLSCWHSTLRLQRKSGKTRHRHGEDLTLMYSTHFSEQMTQSHDLLKIQKYEGSLPVPAHRQPQVNTPVCFQMLLYEDKQAVISSVPGPQMEPAQPYPALFFPIRNTFWVSFHINAKGIMYCTCTCVCICVYMCTCICVHVLYICVHVCMHRLAYVCVYMYVYVFVYVWMCMYLCVVFSINICKGIFIHD